MDKKIRILMVDTYDKEFAGHMAYTFQRLPDFYDKRMVVKKSVRKGGNPSALYSNRNLFAKLRDRLMRLRGNLRILLRYHERLRRSGAEYCFYGLDDYVYHTADDILSVHPDFHPDIISIHWTSKFISSSVIRELHERTGAHIVLLFVDEQYLTGGCHYNCDCDGYLHECRNCRALTSARKLAHDQMLRRAHDFSKIPLSLVGSPYDMEKASRLPMFLHAKFYAGVGCPNVTITPKAEARVEFGLSDDEFVILLGATSLSDVRKGIVYSVEAIRQFAEDHPHVCILLLGKVGNDFPSLGRVRTVAPGFLDKEALVRAFCAADVFLSTSIADSGPYMVNYAAAVGCPTVAFSIGIAPSIVEHERTGFLAQYRSSESVASGIRWAYALTPEERQSASLRLLRRMAEFAQRGPWYERIVNELLSERDNK